MTREEATRVAEAFVRSQPANDKLRLVGARESDKEPGKWAVFYEQDPGPAGGVVDGPVLVIVDAATGKAAWFDDLF